MNEVVERLNEITKALEKGLKNPAYLRLAKVAFEINEFSATVDAYTVFDKNEKGKKIIEALKEDRALTSREKNMLRDVLIGDAIYYVKMEANIEDWMDEMMRHIHILRAYEKRQKLEFEDMFEISATVRDMANVLNDVISYFEAKDRIERYNNEYGSNEAIDRSRKILIELVQKSIDGVDLKEEAMSALREKMAKAGLELKDEERDSEFGETFDEEGEDVEPPAPKPKRKEEDNERKFARKVVKIKRKVLRPSRQV